MARGVARAGQGAVQSLQGIRLTVAESSRQIVTELDQVRRERVNSVRFRSHRSRESRRERAKSSTDRRKKDSSQSQSEDKNVGEIFALQTDAVVIDVQSSGEEETKTISEDTEGDDNSVEQFDKSLEPSNKPVLESVEQTDITAANKEVEILQDPLQTFESVGQVESEGSIRHLGSIEPLGSLEKKFVESDLESVKTDAPSDRVETSEVYEEPFVPVSPVESVQSISIFGPRSKRAIKRLESIGRLGSVNSLRAIASNVGEVASKTIKRLQREEDSQDQLENLKIFPSNSLEPPKTSAHCVATFR